MINRYKLFQDGVLDKETGASIPADISNRQYKEYLDWVDQGNVPDPEFTPEEQAIEDAILESTMLKQDLSKALVWQFRMLQALFEAGQSKGLWTGADFDPTIVQKYLDWKAKLARLEEIDE